MSMVCWLASVLLVTSIDSCNEPSEDTAETWVADSGSTYHTTRLDDSADMMRDIRPTTDKVRAGDSLISWDTARSRLRSEGI